MKILMLLISYDFPPDIRVEKEARALLAAGHEVTVLCENRKNRPVQEEWQGLQIVRLQPQPVWLRQLNTARLFITLRNPPWERQIAAYIREAKPDAIHVHDLPFVGPGVRLGHQFGIPVVADLHENFPAYLTTRRPTSRNPLEWLAFDPARFTRYERQILPQCDRVIAVVEEAAERIAALGVAPEKIVVVSNTEDMEAIGEDDRTVQLPPSAMTLLYVGGLQSNRGLEIAIAAMPLIRQTIPDALLVIVGDGVHRAALEQLVRERGLQTMVQFEGQQPFQRVHSYIRQGDVCLVPHTETVEINTTIPHKLFQYMYMEKPVLVSSAKPLARVIRESGGGAIFQSGDIDDFANQILALQDPAQRAQMGIKGRAAVMERYNWAVDSHRLVNLYAELQAQ